MNNDLDLDLYLQLFKGREDYFAEQGEDWYRPIKGVLDEYYLRRHLEGDATFGLYVLNQASRCHLVCVDIDIPKNSSNPVSTIFIFSCSPCMLACREGDIMGRDKTKINVDRKRRTIVHSSLSRWLDSFSLPSICVYSSALSTGNSG